MQHIPLELLAQAVGMLAGVYVILWKTIKNLEANGLRRIEKTVDRIEHQLDDHIEWHMRENGKRKGPL